MARHGALSNDDASPNVVRAREIDAPQALVFEMWINPRHLSQWLKPEGFSISRCDLDARPGGAIHIDMLAPDSTPYQMIGFFQEIVEPEKLVFSSSPIDGLGHSLLDVLNTVTFTGRLDKTRVTVEAEVLKSTEESVPFLEGMEERWRQSLERLNSYVQTSRRSF